MPKHQHKRSSRLRLFLGEQCQKLTWFLLDPYENWVISHPDPIEHFRASISYFGTYSSAKKYARIRNGSIDGIIISRTNSVDSENVWTT